MYRAFGNNLFLFFLARPGLIDEKKIWLEKKNLIAWNRTILLIWVRPDLIGKDFDWKKRILIGIKEFWLEIKDFDWKSLIWLEIFYSGALGAVPMNLLKTLRKHCFSARNTLIWTFSGCFGRADFDWNKKILIGKKNSEWN